jgi:hypothetical protein
MSSSSIIRTVLVPLGASKEIGRSLGHRGPFGQDLQDEQEGWRPQSGTTIARAAYLSITFNLIGFVSKPSKPLLEERTLSVYSPG